MQRSLSAANSFLRLLFIIILHFSDGMELITDNSSRSTTCDFATNS